MSGSEAKKSKEAKAGRSSKRRTQKTENVKEWLLERRDALRASMRHNLDAAHVEGSPLGGDVSDQASEALEEDTAIHLAEAGSSELMQVEAALRKITEGTYGTCESCGKGIPWQRLEALPYATLCVQCKTKQEVAGSGSPGASGWSAVNDLEDAMSDEEGD